MGILLRIAEGLDRSMSGLIEDLVCSFDGDKVILKTVSHAPVALEINEAMKSAPAFKKIFKRQLEIR
jgi:exopolyphosphatase/guanosine-5'-triphosphate,3'-diphosphate pyrophosphatase